jgi:hypothetical protein
MAALIPCTKNSTLHAGALAQFGRSKYVHQVSTGLQTKPVLAVLIAWKVVDVKEALFQR